MHHRLLLLILLTFLFACQNPGEKKETDAGQIVQTEPHRPQFHFSPDSMWMNDPNGMVYYKGEYHLFYQYYPDSTVWGPMHWGHAVSKDMIHWEHLPIALYPDSLGYIFSGSAVVDKNNTAGFKTGEEDPLVAIFTHHDPTGEAEGRIDYQYQSLAYSNDRGRTWTKYEGNPVIPNPGIRDFRDPNVFWYEEGKYWVMIFAAADRVRLYNSPNLKDWTFTSEFGENTGSHGGVWECPDLFALEVDGQKKWVMLLSINPGGPNGGSATQYFVGDFDGKTFRNDNPEDLTLWVDWGKDNYAGVTWSDIPETDGRRIFLGWMSNWQYAQVVPTERWRSAMTLPRTLSLVATPLGNRLISQPVREVESLRGEMQSLSAGEITGTQDLALSSSTVELELEFELGENPPSGFGVELSNSLGEKVRIGFQPDSNRYFIDRRESGKVDFSPEFPGIQVAPREMGGNTINMHLIVDVASVELFADGGQVVMTGIFFPNEDFGQVRLFSDGGGVKLVGGRIWDTD